MNKDKSMLYLKEQKGKWPAFQLQIECLDVPYSEFFPFSKYGGSMEKALAAAQEARDNVLEVFAEELAPHLSRYVRIGFSSANNTGIVGVNRTYNKKDNTWFWQSAWNSLDGKPNNRSRSTKKHGEKQALLQVIDLRYEALLEIAQNLEDEAYINHILEHLSKYDALKSYLNKLSPSEENLLFNYLSRQDITGTEKEQLINARICQETFRKRVLEFWGNKCCITGANDLLVAAHIKPWRESTDAERIDVYNGLSLSPVYDKAFDFGLISFSDEGEIIISGKFEDNSNKLKVNINAKLPMVTPLHIKYLEYHRKNIFKNK
ncbi:MAG: HNH endonuclease [Deltaproteobacteria bacterium]|nr:HNH endonuclease [Deltaproteobacteria bacterium]